MAEASPVLDTSSRHPQAPQGQPISLAATEPSDDTLNAMGPPAPYTSPVSLGRTREQTMLLQEGESGEGRPTGPNLPDAANERWMPPPSTLIPCRYRHSGKDPQSIQNPQASAAVTVVSSGKEYDKLHNMITNVDRKIQAIGEMLERHLTAAASEQNPTRLPLCRRSRPWPRCR